MRNSAIPAISYSRLMRTVNIVFPKTTYLIASSNPLRKSISIKNYTQNIVQFDSSNFSLDSFQFQLIPLGEYFSSKGFIYTGDIYARIEAEKVSTWWIQGAPIYIREYI